MATTQSARRPPPRSSPSAPPNAAPQTTYGPEHVERSVEKMVHGIDASSVYPIILAAISSEIAPTDACDKIFKALFRSPIRHDPIVAFRACALLHNLILDGPDDILDAIRRNEPFMDWLENCWTRDATQKFIRSPNQDAASTPLGLTDAESTHLAAIAFGSGEIAYFASFLRRKAKFHMLAAGGFTGTWERTGALNEDGYDVIATRRKKVVGGIADLVEMASELGVLLAAASDIETASVKHTALRSLVDEVGHAHQAVLSLVDECTSAEAVQKFASAYDRIWEAAKALIVAVRPLPVAAGEAWEESLAGDRPRDVVTEIQERLDEELRQVAEAEALEISAMREAEREQRRLEKEERRAQRHAEKEAAAAAKAAARAAKEAAKKEASEAAAAAAQKALLLKAQEAAAKNLTTQFGNLLTLDDHPNGTSDIPERIQQRPHPGLSDSAALAAAFGASDAVVEGSRYLALPSSGIDGQDPHHNPYASEDDEEGGGYEDYRERQAEEEARREEERREISTGSWAVRAGYGNMALVTTGPSSIPGKRHPAFCQCADCESVEAQVAAATAAKDDIIGGGIRDDTIQMRTAAAYRPNVLKQDNLYDDPEGATHGHGGASGIGVGPRVGSGHQRSRYSAGLANDAEDDADSYRSVSYSVGEAEAQSDGEYEAQNPPLENGKEQPEDLRTSKRTSHSSDAWNVQSRVFAKQVRSSFVLNPKKLRIAEKIGEGAFGVVYRGQYQGETVAIKKMHKHLVKVSQAVSSFAEEVSLMSQLEHPSILKCIAASTNPPDVILVTEFMKRGTLFDVLYRDRIKLTWALIRKIALQVAKGMAYLHSHSILHRDLKSGNLMVDEKYNVKVGDFGLAKPEFMVDSSSGLSGTYQYMAPEILRGELATAMSDVYAFALVLWEMISVQPPFLGMEPLDAARRVLEEDLRPPIPPHCSRPYAEIIKICWSSSPEARPSFNMVVEMIEKTTN